MQTVQIDLQDRSYPIYIGDDLLQKNALLSKHIRSKQIMIVTNEVIAPHYQSWVEAVLSGFNLEVVTLPDGEIFKNLDTLNSIFDKLLEARFDRGCTLLALGGGVVGDMAGFAAASYQRGVDFVQIPTTLLAQVDSSVGGKTGVNHALGKNMIGAFHQPRCVIADTRTLATLPDSELRAGLAEVIKYGLIVDAEFYSWLEDNLPALLRRESDALTYAIKRSCEIKAEIVASDEKERGRRALLNLGHTFGHAIEAVTGYGQWLHGEAVATGMVMAMDLSHRLGWLNNNQYQSAKALIQAAELPIKPPVQMTPELFLNSMLRDKKTRDGHLNLILMHAIGEASVVQHDERELLNATLEHFCTGIPG